MVIKTNLWNRFCIVSSSPGELDVCMHYNLKHIKFTWNDARSFLLKEYF